MNARFSLRPAVLADSHLAVTLIRLSMGAEMDWLFGQEAGLSADQVMTALYLRRGNRFSWQFCQVAEMDGYPVGLLLAYPGRKLFLMEVITALQLLGICGITATWRIVRRQRAYGNLVEARRDEFYLSNLGVLPEYQGQGLGGWLLEQMDIQARAAGLRKCSLLVARDNPAVHLYRRHGYQIETTYTFPVPEIGHGVGFYRMVKSLT
ncbi:MAG: GNAT family N-acetyltransferase [Anaerolineales bacterium]|nr:GNAT family N-acetyltransferase [Anaerolineales bacterium]